MRLSRRKFLKALGASLLVPGSALSEFRPAPPGNLRMAEGGKTTHIADTGNAVTNGANLQAALDAAAGGDIIEMAPGATYQGPIVLRDRGNTVPITLRTAGYGRAGWPAKTYKVTPAHGSLMATLAFNSSALTSPILLVAEGAHHWRIYGLQFTAASPSYSSIFNGGFILINRSNTATRSNVTADSNMVFCRHIDIRHCLIRGDATYKAAGPGIGINAGDDITVNDCWIDRLGTGFYEDQAFVIVSGHRITVQNCYIEGCCETFWIGGGVRYPVHDTKQEAYDKWQPQDITVKYCHITRPDAMYPRSVNWAERTGTRMVINNVNALKVSSPDYTFVSDDIGKTIYFPPYDRVGRRAFRKITGVEGSAAILADAATNDLFGPGDTIDEWRLGRYWYLKNLFESKTSANVLVHGCIFDTFYVCEQISPIVLSAIDQTIQSTPAGAGEWQPGTNSDPWVTHRNVTFEYNVFRHFANWISIIGHYTSGHPIFPRGVNDKSDTITFRNNLLYGHDLDKYNVYHGGWLIAFSEIDNFTFEKNTVWINSASSYPFSVTMYAGWNMHVPTAAKRVSSNFIFRSNLLPQGQPLNTGSPSGFQEDENIWNGPLTSSDWRTNPDWTCSHNVLAGAQAGDFSASLIQGKWPTPSGTYHNLGSEEGYTVSAMETTHFQNVVGNDYRLKADSALNTAGYDGGCVGADVAAIHAAIANIR